jgi:hypothetical protein
MSPFAAAILAILAIAVALGFVVARAEGLGFFVPRTTRGIGSSAQRFCTRSCRLADGNCPLTKSEARAADCPLWKYVEADTPTVAYGSPFAA